MCGIAGFYRFKSTEIDLSPRQLALRQIATMRYRGPDAVDAFVGPGVALAHARLSIMDVSTTANQPMSDASGDITIVFNSEIYNFKSIREELEKRGRRFKTRPDIEVIIEGCIAWGEDVGDRLRGMFAIFDRRRDRLPLLRDRVGRKALYYTVINNARILGCRHSGKAALRRTRAEIAAQARDGAVPAEGALMYRPKMGFGVPTRIWALLMLEVWFRTRVDANLLESLAASDARLALW